MPKRTTQYDDAEALAGTEKVLISQLSSTVTISAATISALASDNSFNDSANGFIAAGFAVNNNVNVSGFTGDVANNIQSGVITELTAGKMTIAGDDGNVIVDDAAGETVVITKWNTVKAPHGQGEVEEAPEDGTQYARIDGGWSAVEGGGGGGGGAGGGLYEYVETVTATSAAQLDIPLPDTEEAVIILDVTAITDNVDIRARISDDAFATVESGASDYRWQHKNNYANGTTYTATADANFADDSDSFMRLLNGLGNAAGEFARLEIKVANPNNASRVTSLEVKGFFINATGTRFTVEGSAVYDVASVVDGLRIFLETGNITATARMYKLVTSGSDGSSSSDVIAYQGFSAGYDADDTNVDLSAGYLVPWAAADVIEDIGGWHDPASPEDIVISAGVDRVDVGFSVQLESLNNASTPLRMPVISIRKDTGSGYAAIDRQAFVQSARTFHDGTGAFLSVSQMSIPVEEGDKIAARIFCDEATATLKAEATSITVRPSFISGNATTGSGTSFPVSPSDGDKFYRTDRNIEYFYDLANTQWLSTQLFERHFSMQDAVNPYTGATSVLRGVNPWQGRYALWVETFDFTSLATSTTASNYYTGQLIYTPDGTASNITVGGTASSQGNTQNTFTSNRVDVNAEIPATASAIQARFTETGSATEYLGASMTYRLVG